MLLIKNGKILTMAGKVINNGCVLIKNSKIEEVAEKIKVDKNVDVIDAKGGWVMPGIIDAHSHIGMFEENMGFEGNDGNEATDAVTPQMRAIDAVNPRDGAFAKAVKAGVTTVMTGPGSANVIGGQFLAMKTAGSCVDDMIIMAPSAMKIAFGENPKRVYHGKGKSPSTRMATAAILREALMGAEDYKNKKEEALKKGDFFERNIKMEALIPVLERKIPLKAHAHRADDILTAIRIAKEFNLRLTLDHCTEGHLIKEKIKSSGYAAIVGPTMSFNSKIELTNKTFDTPKELFEQGIKIAIITDHPVIHQEYLSLCAGLAVKAGLPMEEGLKAITINAAEICGIDDRVGSLEKGKDADVVIFDGNPMDIFTQTLYTIINGKIVHKI